MNQLTHIISQIDSSHHIVHSFMLEVSFMFGRSPECEQAVSRSFKLHVSATHLQFFMD